MRKNLELRSRSSAVAAACAALLLAPMLASGEEATFRVTLSGPQASGDPDGRGEATVTLHPEANRAEVRLDYANIAPPTALHLRVGPTGLVGNVVLPFVIESDDGGSLVATRISAKPGIVETIAASPSEYYLVVINEEHPVGALRGQLRE